MNEDKHPQPQADGPAPADQDLLADCVAALGRALPEDVEADWRPAAGGGRLRPDARLRVRRDGQTIDYVVEVKRTLRQAALGPIAHLAHQWADEGERLLLCATRIPDRLGAELRERGVDYLDADGNACLHGPGVFVHVQGRKPTARGTQRTGLRGTDVRLLGVFLRDEDAGEQVQTELARRAGIALGAVGKARETLVRRGILEPTGPRAWRVRDRDAGLRLFGDGWATHVRGRLHPRAFRVLDDRETLEERIAAAGPDLGILLGGERAAGHLTGFLATDHATLHVPARERRRAVEALGLVPLDGGTITLIDRYGEGDRCPADELPDVPLIHPLWVWAECLTVHDERVALTAQKLLEELGTRA